MSETSQVGLEARDRLSRVLVGVTAQIKGDLLRIREFPESGVHSLRRRMKKLGSMLRLARKCISDRGRQGIRRRMRLLKDAFARTRDADVMRQLAEGLGIPSAVAGLTKNTRPRVTARHIRAAEQLCVLIGNLQLHELTSRDVASSFLHSLKMEREARKRAREDATPEALHAWRKQSKALYYQMLFLHEITGKMGKPMKHAARLGRWLGKHHDLDMLAARLKRGGETQGLRKKIARRQRELRRRIFRAGDLVHDKLPTKRHVTHMIASGRE